MKKRLLSATLVLAAALAGPARAQDSLVFDEPIDRQLEFLANLRAKGFAALGNEYLDRLLLKAGKGDLPRLNLERGRNAAALAREGKRPEQKTKLLAEARGYFEPFVKANPKSLEGAQARLELAKLLSLQARVVLHRALAEEDEKDREAGAKQARDLYDQADAEFAASIKALAALGTTTEPAQVQAQFDRANTLIDKAYAFLNLENEKQNRTRAETVNAAEKIFVEIGKDRESPNGLLAHAYLVKAAQESRDMGKAAKHYNIVMEATGKEAEPAQRLARYFDILYVRKNENLAKLSGTDRLRLLASEAQKWVKEYPSAKRTYLGESIRFEEALANLQLAAALTDGFKQPKYDKLKSVAKDLAAFNAATKDVERLTRELESEGGDFAERALRMRQSLQIEMLKLAGSKQQPKGFEGTYLQAQLEFAEARKAAKDDVRKQHLRQGMYLLQKAVGEAYQEKAPLTKIHDARFQQGAVYLGIGDPYRAAISFENLARADPPSRKGAEAAAYAIELYRTVADKEHDATARQRLHELADYVFQQKLWVDEKVIGVTRYNLALDLQARDKNQEALDQLEKLPKDFPAYAYAQGNAVFIALKARDRAEEPEEKAAWTQAARKALARMGPLAADADASTTLMWFVAQAEGPKFQYADAVRLTDDGKVNEAEMTYQAMAKSVAGLEAAFKKSGDRLAPNRKESVGFTLVVLDKYARLGLAGIEYRKGHYDKVLGSELLGPAVNEIVQKNEERKKANAARLKKNAKLKKGDEPEKLEDKIKVKDVRVVAESLSLALRAFVQDGKPDAAKSMYELMLLVETEEGGTDSVEITRRLVRDLAKQVEDLKEKNDTAMLKEMVSKFAGFVDELAKQLAFSKKNPDPRDIKDLARFYESLDLFKKGADLYRVVPVPKNLDQKGKFTEQEEQALADYWDLQVAYGRLLRQAKDYKEANKVLERVIAHPNARYQTLAEKEKIHIYEDMESYGTAIKLWKSYMDTLQRAGLAANPRLKKYYFDGYYANALCFYKYSQSAKVKQAGKEDAFLTAAANYIVRLETASNREGWDIVGRRFQELLAKEKRLRSKYDELKKQKPAA